MKKLLEVSKLVLTRKGEVYQEFQIDGLGRMTLESGEKKYQHQLEKEDIPCLENRKIGDLINYALDLPEEKLTPKERRARFILATRIQEAMETGKDLVIEKEDETRIEGATEGVKSAFFLDRILSSLEEAEKVDSKPRLEAAE